MPLPSTAGECSAARSVQSEFRHQLVTNPRGGFRNGIDAVQADGLFQRIEIGETIRARLDVCLDGAALRRIQIGVEVFADIAIDRTATLGLMCFARHCTILPITHDHSV